MLDLVLWAICGTLAGWVACIVVADGHRAAMPGFVTIGILGALLGGLLASLSGMAVATTSDLLSTVSAIFGSVLLVLIVRLLKRTKTAHK